MRKIVMLIVTLALAATLHAADVVPLTAVNVGYRGDGSGIFPVTGVPTTWDVAKGTNVLWKATLPERALSEPVVVGDRVLVAVEPEWLYCFDAATGKECWKAEVSALDGLDPAVQAKGRETLTKIIDLWKTGAAYNDPRYDAFKVDTDMIKKVAGIDVVRNGLFGNVGYANGTPVSDGKYVWARFGTGSIGCYELATGNKVWLRKAPMQSGLVILGTQIAVIGDRLYLVEDPPKGTSKALYKTSKQITGLDAATGKEVWHSKPIVRGNHGDGGGLVPVTVGGTVFLATSNGQVIDTVSGEVLISDLGNCGYSTNAYALPDAVCYGFFRARLKNEGGKLVAVDLPLVPLISKLQEHAIVFGDLSYLAGSTGLGIRNPANRDLKHDEHDRLIDSDKRSFSFGFKESSRQGGILQSVVGGLLYCPAADGRLAVVKPGEKPELVALNVFPEGIIAPCSAGGGRLFVRTVGALYAIGTK